MEVAPDQDILGSEFFQIGEVSSPLKFKYVIEKFYSRLSSAQKEWLKERIWQQIQHNGTHTSQFYMDLAGAIELVVDGRVDIGESSCVVFAITDALELEVIDNRPICKCARFVLSCGWWPAPLPGCSHSFACELAGSAEKAA